MNSELAIIFESFRQACSYIDKRYNTALKQLGLWSYPQEITTILFRVIPPFGLQDQDFLVKCLSETITDLSAAKIT